MSFKGSCFTILIIFVEAKMTELRVVTDGKQIVNFQTFGNVNREKLVEDLSEFFATQVNSHTCNGSTVLFTNSPISFECCGAQEIEKKRKDLKNITGIEVHFEVNTDKFLPIKAQVFIVAKEFADERFKLLETIKEISAQIAEANEYDKAALDKNSREARAQLKRVMERLTGAEEAICRIARNEFGICTICGEKIKIDRLWSVPTTPFCKICGAGAERQNKRMGT